MERGQFKASELRLVSLRETWTHMLQLMALANNGVTGARHLADITMDRYFERIQEAQHD